MTPAMRNRVRPPAVAATLAITAALLAGCGTEEPGPTEPSSTSTSPTPSPSPSATPSESPTESGPFISGTGFPGLNENYRWREVRTGKAGSEPFGICSQFSLVDIGAEDVQQRDYAPAATDPADTSLAAEQVATFADSQTAVRASKVVEAWRAKCTSTEHPDLKVGAWQPVSVPSGQAQSFLATHKDAADPDSGHFLAFGMLRDDTRIALLRIESKGQDYNYEPGQEPMSRALKAAAEALARP